MKNSKRILSLLLALTLVLSVLPISAFAADENPTSGTCGENLTWVLTDDGTLTISGTGAMTDYGNGEAPWVSNLGSIKALVIEPGVTTIGNSAFFACYAMTDVTIPATVTSIGNYAFANCESMTELTIPEGVETIGNYAFENWRNMTGLTISNTVTTIGEYAFDNCRSLTSVVIPDSVTSLGEAVFYCCGSLTEAVLPDGMTEIPGWTFFNCGLTEITIPDSVTSIGRSAFCGCDMSEVVVPSGVVSIANGAFANCENLTSIIINNPNCVIGDKYDGGFTCGDPEVTVIHGYAGSSAQAYAEKWGYQFETIGAAVNPFTDVKETAWYYKAVIWASGNGITGGVGDGKFAPNASCTRAQVVTFLWNAAGKPEPKSTTNPFSDVKSTDYFYKAVLWAVENGVTSGVGNGKFGARDVCTRGQVVAFMWNAAGKPEPKTTTNSFSDVKTTDYYYKAVLWAVENGVTSGTGNGQFSPKAQCTRAAVVTFLYSYYG